MSFLKEEASIYHRLFCRESQKSSAGLKVINDCAKRMETAVHNASQINEAQRYLRLLSIYCTILETFNANVESLVSSTDRQIFEEIMVSAPNTVCVRVKDWIPDLSPYQNNDQFNGVVTYVLDGSQKLCFIQDTSRNDVINFANYVDTAFVELPQYGLVFALEINRKFFRAIRIDSEPTNMAFRVRLIDIGETINVSPNMYKYSLVSDAQELPPMAILCRVDKINGKLADTLSSTIKKVFSVTINNICINMMEVDLNSPIKIAKEDVIQKEDYQQPLANKGEPECVNNDLPVIQTVVHSSSPMASPNPFLADIMVQSNGQQSPMDDKISPSKRSTYVIPLPPRPCSATPLPPVPPRQRQGIPIRIPLDIFKRNQNIIQTDDQQTHKGDFKHNETNGDLKPIVTNGETKVNLSNGDLKINLANGKPTLNGDSKPKMSNGVHSQTTDESKFIVKPKALYQNGNSCHHENDSDRKEACQCKTGAHPKVPQKTLDIDLEVPPCLDMPIPDVNEELVVVIRHIISAQHVFVQFGDWVQRFEQFQFCTMKSVSPKPLSYVPKINDLVLARYGTDDVPYRARIETVDQRSFTVFYVDYGNTETCDFDGLFEWDPVCNSIPFQAVHCRVVNVRHIPRASAQMICEHLKQEYVNKQFMAEVVMYNEGILCVNMKNDFGKDIVQDIQSHLFPECIV